MNHQNIVTTASIQQLWSSAKNQLQLLRDKLAESEEKNRFLETELQNAEHKTKEEEIRSEMQRQEMQSLFEEERREYEQQIHEEHESKKILEENSNTLRRDLQNMQVLLQEKETLQDIRSSEYTKLERTCTTLQLESTAEKGEKILQFDLQARLNASLEHLETQQEKLLESRAGHSTVLAKIAEFENEVILMRSRQVKLTSERNQAIEEAKLHEERAHAAEQDAERVIAWARGAEANASSACVELTSKMEEVQAEAVTVLGLHNAAQTSLVEMREALGLCARREASYRAKVKSYESEIKHLTHKQKMQDFARMAAGAELRGVSASALRAESNWSNGGGGGNINTCSTDGITSNQILAGDSKVWLDSTSEFISETKKLLQQGESKFKLSPRPRVSWT
jgi:hypothetical protein